jgi:hypothetical protein
MICAWYGHLKYKHTNILITILVSWLIALAEYSFQVPANRIGYQVMSATKLKTIQEVINLTVFIAFAALYLGEPITIKYIFGFFLIFAGACVIFYK